VTQTLLLHAYLKKLRLPTVAKLYPKHARDAEASGMTFERFLLALFEAELAVRESNVQKERIRRAKFPFEKDFSEFNFGAISGLNQQKLLHLAEGAYLESNENILLLGNQGTGKTHMAIALGRAACRQGKRVLFVTAAGLANDLAEAQSTYKLSRLEANLAKLDLLIVDELGFVPFSLTSALLDRLTHHAHVFVANGESYRFKESLQRKEKREKVGGDEGNKIR
jgi:DNA replication protein DnaC